MNFITAHDGFTLADAVSYNDKHNEANGEGNRDGHSDNRTANYGAEGPTDDSAIVALRTRQQRNLLATLLLSQGTPMLMAGDEFGRTQKGNNNAYCQDNEISWLDWAGIDERGQGLIRFVRKLTTLRRQLGVLRRNRFLTGVYNEELKVKDVTWLTPAETEMEPGHWQDPRALCFGMLLDGSAQTSGIVRAGSDATVLLVFNSWHEPVNFKLPVRAEGVAWTRLIDTAIDEQKELPEFSVGHEYLVTGRSMLAFLAVAAGAANAFPGNLKGALLD